MKLVTKETNIAAVLTQLAKVQNNGVQVTPVSLEGSKFTFDINNVRIGIETEDAVDAIPAGANAFIDLTTFEVTFEVKEPGAETPVKPAKPRSKNSATHGCTPALAAQMADKY